MSALLDVRVLIRCEGYSEDFVISCLNAPFYTHLDSIPQKWKFALLSALNHNEAVGRLPPQTPPEKVRHITLFLGNTLLDIFKRHIGATSVPLLCQKCGSLSAELGKRSEVLEIVDNSMQ